MSQVSVVIPVFNHFDGVLECLHSVVTHTDKNLSIVVVDDKSSDGSFKCWLSKQDIDLSGWQFEILENEANLGFTRSVNRGMAYVAPNDVIILNSDTVVTKGWVEKLTQAAHSRTNVATVTPFTNNGTVCSLPIFLKDNPLPHNLSIDTFAEVVEACSERAYPTLPTCVGFCTYITRSALNALGSFDEEAFPRGYGEENDFSCRAQKAGYVDLLADDTFVFHAGGKSFGPERKKLMEAGEAVLRSRYPAYYPNVGKFIRENPLSELQNRIHRALLKHFEKEAKPRILHILHNGPYIARRDPIGGTERHVQGVIESLQEFSHWSLVKDKNHYILESFSGGFSIQFSYDADEPDALEKILDPSIFSLVHVHHTRWFNQKELVETLKARIPYIVSLHDFATICPRFHLFTIGGEHCSGVECKSACGYSEHYMREYRVYGLSLLSHSLKNIAFSQNTVEYLERLLPEVPPIEVVQHGVHQIQPIKARTDSLSPLSIITIAPHGRHKGGQIFKELFRVQTLPSGRDIHWSVLGDWEQVGFENCLGPYTPQNVREKLEAANSQVGILLSLCPETYSLACDELLSAGIPVIVGPLGAPAERIKSWEAGWVLEDVSVTAVLRELERISANSRSLSECQARARQCPTIPFSIEASQLATCYHHFIASTSTQGSLELFLESFQQGEIAQPAGVRLLSRIVNMIMNCLEAIRLRAPIQRVLESVLGQGGIRYLKNLR